MFPEPLFDLLNLSGVGWVFIATSYAIFDYIFNFFMCWLTGGIQQIRLLPKLTYTRKKNSVDRKIRQKLVSVAFKAGSHQRVNEFRNDPSSWYWPITILAIPIAFYGFTKSSIFATVNLLDTAGIQLINYRIAPFTFFSNQIQYILIFVAFVNISYSFYRYQYARTASTWFSKSVVFHILRIILFDALLSYLIFNILLVYFDFFSSLYFALLDPNIVYNALHPDLMYGLRPAYNELLLLISLMAILSFLPTIMLIREKKEKYKWIYYLLFVAGLLIAVLFISITLIYQFHIRLDSIHQQSLETIIQQTDISLNAIGVNANLLLKESLGLQYYWLLKEFPNGFILPSWLQYILSFRIILLVLELLSLRNSDKDQNHNQLAIFQRVIEIFS